MKLHRLRVESFAAIREADVEFGPGLNVLYGPNDLGKSTLVEAIRLALLLPHSSTHGDQYVGWTGGEDPMVEMTFETEAQRIWRVRKQFGKRGSSLLQESKNGQDFDDVERGRKVDAKLREILRWGVPEPGGAGGAKGLPTSFLAAALLSTQAEVSGLLRDSLQGDPTGSGKEQIAKALQAVAQDPLFVALLRETQAWRDEAYTDKGAPKTAKGSVFKVAAERVNEARVEKEGLQKIVADSEGAEKKLRELTEKRARKQESLAVESDRCTSLERLAKQATDRSLAADEVRLAREEVLRIKQIGTDVDAAERKVADLVRKIAEAEEALKVAQGQEVAADDELKAAEEAARAEESAPGLTDTVVRQQLELRKSAAVEAARDAQQRIEAVQAAQKLVEDTRAAELELRGQQAKADSARESSTQAAAKEKATGGELHRCDLLERALDVQAADQQVATAQAAVNSEAALQAKLHATLGERAASAERRAAITVPSPAALAPMRKLSTDLAGARGALNVGLVVKLSPKKRLDLQLRKDGAAVEPTSTSRPLEIEANAEVEVSITDVATLGIRGGRRYAQERTQALEDRWTQEVAPHLAAAGVADLDGLDAKVAESIELDRSIKTKDTDLESLRAQIASLSGAAEALRTASARAEVCRAALGDVPLSTLAADLKALGLDPIVGLRKRRQRLSKEVEAARANTNKAEKAHTLADERTRNAQLKLDAAVSSRDSALAAFPEGVETAVAAAQAALGAATAEKETVAAELTQLDNAIEARKRRIDAALGGARANADKARIAVDTAQVDLTTAMTDRASENGQLTQLRKRRDADDLAAAEARLHQATDRHAALPVPDRIVTNDEVTAAQSTVAGLKSDLEAIEHQISKTHGALEHVGGAVARERLRDATEAFEAAEHQEREIEAEYEAWKLLLDQMKEADAAQASNLGQALAPAIAGRFQELTQRRYETVQLTAHLGTEGILVSGALRSADQISVGTREQLATLFRLSLAEFLRHVIVLDDQLVQSDDTRMDWFRTLLTEKALTFQIVVFTCRPSAYLTMSALVPQGPAAHADTDNGFIRAVDLARAVRRR
jgi:energy-coupling factor transporter ATP-binding protein EcfA2